MLSKNLDVLGCKWKWRFSGIVKEPTNNYEVAGYCCFITKTLYIATEYADMKESRCVLEIVNTMFHEYLHAIFFEAELRDQTWFTGNAEHVIISPIARCLSNEYVKKNKIKTRRDLERCTGIRGIVPSKR